MLLQKKKLGCSIAHYDLRFLKPLDEDLLHEVGQKFTRVLTIEDGVRNGGMGSAVLDFCVTMVISRVSRGWDFPMLLCNTDQSMICMPFAVWMKRGYLVQLHR